MKNEITAAGFPSEDEIKEIGAISDPVLRNQWITWSYFRLDRAMIPVSGERNVTWCAFATWASNTAGGFISESVFPAILTDWINRTHNDANPLARVALLFLDVIGLPFHHLAKTILDTVAGAIGGGNKAVFLDIAPPFARLLTMLDGHQHLDPEQEQVFLASLQSQKGENARKALLKAFEALLAGMKETAPGPQAERMLLSSAWIGWIEQTLVQPYIVLALNAPVRDLFHQSVFEHIAKTHHATALLVPEKALRSLLSPLFALAELTFRDLSTVYMMTLNTPTTTFHLGQDVPPLPDGRAFPDDLTKISSPDLDELLMLLHAQKLEGSAAHDWASFDERMRYIATLFRSRLQDQSLRTAPPAPRSSA